tara:strand:- start:360 stop:2063 length:1704 start_codon:yes stop_codon:yes gene_type:complete
MLYFSTLSLNFKDMKRKRLAPLLHLIAILSLNFSHVFAAERPFDLSESEIQMLTQLGEHPDESMRYKLLNSRLREKSSLWEPFQEELDGLSEADYVSLRELIVEKSIIELQEAVNSGQLSYEELVIFYIYRIRRMESDGDRFINGVISLNPSAIERARRLDEIRETNGTLAENSIFGIPVLLKDNIGFANLPTTAGAAALTENFTSNAFITNRLIEQGAIVLGKANLSEWAYFFCRECPSGYSAVGGQTLNPYGRLDFGTGGSSSGSGASLAANYAAVAVGSETSGSILSPSSANSLVGLKPTTGSLSRSGVVPISSTLDTVGPMGRSVADVVTLFNAMVGFDGEDPAMPRISEDLQLSIRQIPSDNRRLGVLPVYADNMQYQNALRLLAQSGFDLQEVDFQNERHPRFSEFLGAEMKRDLAIYLDKDASAEVAIDSISALQDFNLVDLEIRAPYGQALVDLMVDLDLSQTELGDLRTDLIAWGRTYLDRLFVESDIEILLGVNNHQASIAALANYPALTIPMGYEEDGRPAGLTLIAPSFQEQLLVDIGLNIEQILAARRAPTNYP